MYRATYVTRDNRVKIEFDAEDQKGFFSGLALCEEIADLEPCGCCKSERVRHEVRKVDAYVYYKLVCMDCRATLDFGQAKEGNRLFVKRGKSPKTNGWAVYQSEHDGPPQREYDPSEAYRESGPF